jgi:hypothetical protein
VTETTPATPVTRGFEYEVKLAVSIPLAWATLLKTAAKHHYDWKCREIGERGVINGLYNTAVDSKYPSTIAVRSSDVNIVMKVAEQLHHHTQDRLLVVEIRTWLRETFDAIEQQWEVCMKLPGSAER